MSLINDKGIELTVALTILTNNGSIEWKRGDIPKLLRRPGETCSDGGYACHCNGDIFRIRENISAKTTKYFGLLSTCMDTADEVVLEVVDDDGRVLWQVPNNPAIINLYKRVQEKTFNIDAVLERVSRLTKTVA